MVAATSIDRFVEHESLASGRMHRRLLLLRQLATRLEQDARQLLRVSDLLQLTVEARQRQAHRGAIVVRWRHAWHREFATGFATDLT